MLSTNDLHWLAGLIEGEGCFYSRKGYYPAISLNMTDEDVVQRVADLWEANISVDPRASRPNCKPTYMVKIYGRKATSWMMTLYSLMGKRRQAKIKEILPKWWVHPAKVRLTRRLCGGVFDKAA